MMEDCKKTNFDKDYIQELYLKYLATERTQENHLDEFKSIIQNKIILIIAPGKSSIDESPNILEFIKNQNVITISINHCYTCCKPDFIFISNIRRFKQLPEVEKTRCITTSNITADNVYLQTKYRNLLNDIEMVRDNAGLMLIKFLINLGVKNVYVAGMDGYSHDREENYSDNNMTLIIQNAILDSMNEGMRKVLKNYSNNIAINFITKPKHIQI